MFKLLRSKASRVQLFGETLQKCDTDTAREQAAEVLVFDSVPQLKSFKVIFFSIFLHVDGAKIRPQWDAVTFTPGHWRETHLFDGNGKTEAVIIVSVNLIL